MASSLPTISSTGRDGHIRDYIALLHVGDGDDGAGRIHGHGLLWSTSTSPITEGTDAFSSLMLTCAPALVKKRQYIA